MELTALFSAVLPEDHILTDEPLSDHSTMKAGGPADLYVSVETQREVVTVVRILRENHIPFEFLGNSSNTFFRDGGYRGAVIQWNVSTEPCVLDGDLLRVPGGMLLSRAAAFALRAGLSGMECLSGIPGTVGGAAAMNAGAYGGSISDVCESLTILDEESTIRQINGSEMNFGYRHTLAMDRGWIVLEAAFRLTPDDPEAIRARMDDYAARRREKQPLEYASCGSTFKRPEGYFAGALIEQAGLKGYSVGDASVSEKHAGFIINRGRASAGEILAVMKHVQNTVFEKFGVHLEPEVRVMGEEPGGEER